MKEKPNYGIYAWPYIVSVTILGLVGMVLILLSGSTTLSWTLPAAVPLTIVGFYLASAHYLTLRYYENKDESFVKELSRLLKSKTEKKILDIGSGTGRTAIAISKGLVHCEVVGIDTYSRKSIFSNSPRRAFVNAELEGVERNVFFMYGDASSIPFKDRCFDIATAGSVLHLLTSKKRNRAVQEIRRALTDGGVLIIIEWLRSVRAILLYLIPAFFIFQPRSYWVQLLRDNGLENIRTAQIGNLGIFYAEKHSRY